ncbi:MAG: carboxymuconolactone decarboxylase family protein, partial [Pseudomonadales bacterium]|nr:carboxymuconolactone decarboxylase family protein [Pseudomonadales bacterium]
LMETAESPRFKNRPELRQAGVYQTLANHPNLFRAIGGLMTHILDKNSLADRLREIVIVRACARARGAYPYYQHLRIGRQAGLTEAELSSLG